MSCEPLSSKLELGMVEITVEAAWLQFLVAL